MFPKEKKEKTGLEPYSVSSQKVREDIETRMAPQKMRLYPNFEMLPYYFTYAGVTSDSSKRSRRAGLR